MLPVMFENHCYTQFYIYINSILTRFKILLEIEVSVGTLCSYYYIWNNYWEK